MTRQYFISFALLDGDSIRLGNGIIDMPEKITKQDGFYFGAYGYLGIPTQLVRSKVVTYNADRTTIKKGPLYPEIGARASIGQRFGDYAASFNVEHGFNNLLPKSGWHLNWFSVQMSFRWFL